jgi:hypothetical protein
VESVEFVEFVGFVEFIGFQWRYGGDCSRLIEIIGDMVEGKEIRDAMEIWHLGVGIRDCHGPTGRASQGQDEVC